MFRATELVVSHISLSNTERNELFDYISETLCLPLTFQQDNAAWGVVVSLGMNSLLYPARKLSACLW